jgi:hypothetical protein
VDQGRSREEGFDRRMNLVKLDRRYNGYPTFTHRFDAGQWYGAEARRKGLVSFYDMRCYMTQMNGVGCFIQEAGALRASNREVPEWGWDMEGNVYFRDSALVNFTLAKDRWL